MEKRKLTPSECGRLGALARARKPKEQLSLAAKLAEQTRKAKDPNTFKVMGAKGGRISRGGGRPKINGENA